MTSQQMSDMMDAEYMAGVNAFPAKTEALGNQLMVPVMDGDVKVYDITADEIRWEVEPGKFRDGTAYNGQIPGPQIRVNQGDRVRIFLHNKLEESTPIHFHGVKVPNSMDGVPGITQPLVKPGESFTYEFTVTHTGTHMYHSHMNGANQISGGLMGAFIISSDQDPLAAHEELMVVNDGPLGYTLNGKGFPATQPIVAKLGSEVRIRYMNEGLQIHPMHLHGMNQTVIAKDGILLKDPYEVNTLLVAPGETFDVIVKATEPGVWAYHCHILSHAEGQHGMFGMVTAFVVTE
ncbi:MAG: copper oxidase [SAR202 cluster bacterium]|nr:copper oxidase [SAR202 cluster bacterium]